MVWCSWVPFLRCHGTCGRALVEGPPVRCHGNVGERVPFIDCLGVPLASGKLAKACWKQTDVPIRTTIAATHVAVWRVQRVLHWRWNRPCCVRVLLEAGCVRLQFGRPSGQFTFFSLPELGLRNLFPVWTCLVVNTKFRFWSQNGTHIDPVPCFLFGLGQTMGLVKIK